MQKKFSYPIKIDELNQNQYHFTLVADNNELKDITQILQVENVKAFVAEIFIKRNIKNHLMRVWGNVKAQIELKSVISLENFVKDYNTEFELIYDTEATYQDIKNMESSINDEVPDIVENGVINLADIVIEQIALCLDDYPRVEGEVFDFAEYEKIKSKDENPFAILQKLKK